MKSTANGADGDLDGDLNFTSSSVLRSGPLSPGNLNKPLLCRIVKVCFLAALVQLVSRHCAFRGWAGLRGSIEVDAVRSKVFANFGLVSTILVSQAMEAEVLSELQNRKVAFEHADVESERKPGFDFRRLRISVVAASCYAPLTPSV